MSHPPFVSMCVRDVVVHGVASLLRLRLSLGVFVNHVSAVLVFLGTSNVSFQFIMIGLHFSMFFLMASFYLYDAGLELLEWFIVHHGCHRSRVDIFRGCLSLESGLCANHMCRWSWGEFNCNPMVDAKCTC